MATIQDIQEALVRADAMYSELNTEHISDLRKGCDGCEPKNYKCLNQLIIALEWEVTKPTVSDIANSLYDDLMLILGNYIAPVAGLIAYGYSVTDPNGVVETVNLPSSLNIPEDTTEYTVPFPALANLNYPVIRELATEPVKNFYENTINNYGSIPDSKWRVAVVGSHRYYYGRTPFAFDAESMNLVLKQV